MLALTEMLKAVVEVLKEIRLFFTWTTDLKTTDVETYNDVKELLALAFSVTDNG